MIYSSSNFFTGPRPTCFVEVCLPYNFILSEVGIHATVKKA